jgi:hypothetical protein
LFIYYPARKGLWLRRLLPTAGYILLGMLPGMAVSWPEVFKSQGEVIQSQTLLWYRLLPSSTYPLGVIPGLIIAVGAALIFLVYLLATGKWRLDVWQALASLAVMVGFLGSGLVASSKIGGGSNLHNMDMFLVSFLLLFMMAVTSKNEQGVIPATEFGLWRGILLIALIIPAWSALWGGKPLQVPSRAETDKVIAQIQNSADSAKQTGEVLFMDQRQLLTFGNIKGIPLAADYEKKYMMDQAMAGNAKYFAGFYADLKARRFSLIVSETQKINYQSGKDDFNEENNAWVKWISEPFLEYYRPIATFKDYGFSLYVPK